MLDMNVDSVGTSATSKRQPTFDVVRADALGFCFGVRDALAVTRDRDDAEDVTVFGELVHNEDVNSALRESGYEILDERRRAEAPLRRKVMITAHGISDTTRRRLERETTEVIDTTCPLVRRAHDTAKRLADEGRHVVVVGKPGHVEVEGIVEDLPSATVIPTPADVSELGFRQLGIVSQTTMPPDMFEAVVEAIRERHATADIAVADTVCEPTRRRIAAVEELAKHADVVVVVGGENSNNTRRLVHRAEEKGAVAHHVQSADDLDVAWFDATCRVVGLTAGTSTPDADIAAVERRLRELAARA